MKPTVLEKLPPVTHYGEVVLDVEIFGAKKSQLHRPYGEFGCVTACFGGEKVYLIEKASQVETLLNRIDGCRLIFHNATFDIMQLRRWGSLSVKPIDQFWDTMIVDKVLFSNWFGEFDLGALARRYLGVYLEKAVREEFADATVMTQEQKEYAAIDAMVTHQIYKAQEPFPDYDPYSRKVWERIDGPMTWAVLDFKGIPLDVKAWNALSKTAEAEAARIVRKLKFNVASNPQVKAKVEERLQISLPNVREDTLAEFADDKLVADILRHRECAKLASTYGRNFMEFLEADGCIYPKFNVIGAETGRMSSSSPNAQNIPKRKEYRACFTAGKGERMYRADYGSQEPRVIAGITGAKVLLDGFEHGVNPHVAAGRAIFQDPTIEKDDTDQRYRNSKDLNLGLGFGLSASGLARRTGKSYEEAELDIERYFSALPEVKQYIDRYRAEGRRNQYVRTADHRRVWLNVAYWGHRNNAINAPVQGTAAGMTKTAVVKLHRIYGEALPICIVVHDELVGRGDKAKKKEYMRNIQNCMIEAFQELFPQVSTKKLADVFDAPNWG